MITRARRAAGVLVTTIGCSATFAAPAGAHAQVSPSVVQAGRSETYTVVVPTEGSAKTTAVQVSVPGGFQIGSFEAAPGWKRSVQATGSGEATIVSKVTWTGGQVPEGEAAYLRFQGEAADSGDFAFKVRQTYSDGKVADWSGEQDSQSPAPVVQVEDSLGGGDSNSTLAVIALAVGTIALLLGLVRLAVAGGRPLT